MCAILVAIPKGAMERHRKQLASTLVLAFALIAAVATFLLPPSLQAQTQAQPKGIDPALLAKVLDRHPGLLNEVRTA
jgi:hypothetical protein